MAQLVLGVAGAVVGGAFGPLGAQIGFALGSAVGASLTTQRVQGPRLSDLKAPQASYGSVVPYIEGSVRVAGVWAWTSDKREVATATESGGKGGPTVETTTYTYYMDALILLSESEISGVRRVWSNGKVIWSATEDATLETLLASDATDHWDGMRVYTGSATQMPDSVYEAAVGTANAVAYRGRGYVFFEGLNLGPSGQIPVLTFEVYTGQLREVGDIQDLLLSQSLPSAGGGPGAGAFADVGVLRVPIAQWDSGYATKNVKVYDFDVLNETTTQVGSYDVTDQYVSTLAGWSDVPLFVQAAGTAAYTYEGLTGTESTFTLSESLSEGLYARGGDNIVFGARFFGSQKIYRHAATGGAAVATSDPLPVNPTALWIAGDSVYVAGYSNETVYVLDLDTLALTATLTTPLFGGAYDDSIPIVFELDGEVCLASSATPPGNTYPVYAYRGSWVQIGNLSGSFVHGQYTSGSLVVAGNALIGARTYTGPARYDVKYAALLGERQDLELADVVAAQCERAGLTAAQYDVSALSDTVHGFALTQLVSPRQAIEALMVAHQFDALESNGKIVFRPKGQASVASIAYDDLGASAGERIEPLPLVRTNDLEVPSQVVVKYANWLNDHQDGAEMSDRLVSSLATAVETIELAMALTPTEARRVADVRVAEIVNSAMRVEGLSVDRSLAALEPTDAITVVDEDGSTYRLRVLRITDSGLVRRFDAALDEITATISTAATDEDYTAHNQVLVRADTSLALLDVPILRDADDDTGHYAAVAKASHSGSWPGAVLYRGENDAGYTSVATFADRTYVGAITGTLAAPPSTGTVFDEVTTFAVTGYGTLESWTRDDILGGSARPLLVGAEVLFYRTATYTSPGAYTISGLLRGRRGTEWAVGAHTANERVVLLQTSGLRRVSTPTAKLGVELDFKAATTGQALDTILPSAFTNTAIGQRPFAPVDARFSESGGAISVTWKRRTRLAPGFAGASGITVPLGEATEAYEVDVLSGSPLAVVGTIATTSPSANLSSASALLSIGVGVERLIRRASDSAIVGLEWSDPSFIVAATSAGAFDERSSYFGSDVVEIAASSSTLVVAVSQVDGVGGWANSKLRSVPLASITSPLENPPAVSHTAGTAGDYGGLVWDGTNPWTIGRITGYLRKHDASTLAVLTETLVQGPVAPLTEAYLRHLAHRAGIFFTACSSSAEVFAIDPAGSPTIVWRVSVSGAGAASGNPPLQVVGDTLVVPTDAGWALLDVADGSVLASSSTGEQVPPRCALSSTEFVVRKSAAESYTAYVRSTVDGSLVRSVAGLGSGAILGVFEGSVVQKRLAPSNGTYILGDAEVAAGDVVRIYQLSDTYGRGLPLEAVVPSL